MVNQCSHIDMGRFENYRTHHGGEQDEPYSLLYLEWLLMLGPVIRQVEHLEVVFTTRKSKALSEIEVKYLEELCVHYFLSIQ